MGEHPRGHLPCAGERRSVTDELGGREWHACGDQRDDVVDRLWRRGPKRVPLHDRVRATRMRSTLPGLEFEVVAGEDDKIGEGCVAAGPPALNLKCAAFAVGVDH